MAWRQRRRRRARKSTRAACVLNPAARAAWNTAQPCTLLTSSRRRCCSLRPCAPLACGVGPAGTPHGGGDCRPAADAAGARRGAQLLAGDLDKFGNRPGARTLEAVSVWPDEITRHAGRRGRAGTTTTCRYAAARPRRATVRTGSATPSSSKRLIALLARSARGAARSQRSAEVDRAPGRRHSSAAARGGQRRPRRQPRARSRSPGCARAVARTCTAPGTTTWSGLRCTPATASSRLPTSTRWRSRRAASSTRPARGRPTAGRVESNNLARNVAYHYPGFACDSVPRGIVVLDAGLPAAGRGARARAAAAGRRTARGRC